MVRDIFCKRCVFYDLYFEVYFYCFFFCSYGFLKNEWILGKEDKVLIDFRVIVVFVVL